jgi:hypothetical protein
MSYPIFPVMILSRNYMQSLAGALLETAIAIQSKSKLIFINVNIINLLYW